MRDTDLFQLALGLLPPWMVKACNFDAEARRLDIEIDFARGGRFPCPHCAMADCPVHDTAMQTWRHLDFFQHQAFLHSRTPRITCPDCGVKQIAVPWARAGSGSSRGTRPIQAAKSRPDRNALGSVTGRVDRGGANDANAGDRLEPPAPIVRLVLDDDPLLERADQGFGRPAAGPPTPSGLLWHPPVVGCLRVGTDRPRPSPQVVKQLQDRTDEVLRLRQEQARLLAEDLRLRQTISEPE